MNPREPRCIQVRAFVAALSVTLLAACTGSPATEPSVAPEPSAAQTPAQSAAASSPVATVAAIIDPDDPDAWRHACLITPEEMTAMVASLEAIPNMQTSQGHSNDCRYGGDAPSLLVVGIEIWPYSPTRAHYYMLDGDSPGWLAPSAPEGFANACSAFEAAPLDHPYEQNHAICEPTIGAGVAIDKARNYAEVFVDGPYFYWVTLYGVGGEDRNVEPLLAIARAIVAAEPAGS